MTQWLKITRNGKVEILKFNPNQTLNLFLEENTEYQLVDETGKAIEGVEIIPNGNTLEFYLPDQSQFSLILQHSGTFQPFIVDGVVSLSHTPILSTEISTGFNFSTLAYMGGGLLAAGGIAAVAGGGGSKGGKKEDKTSIQPEPRTEISSKEVEEIRKQAELEEVRKQAEQEKARQEEARKQAEQEKARQEEARKQAEQEKARQEEARKQAEQEKARQEEARKQAEQEKARQEEARKQEEEQEKACQEEEAKKVTPVLTFDKITGDDVINAEEAKRSLTVSGKVQHLQENDRLLLKIGEVTYPVTVLGEAFSAEISGATLVNHREIAAEVVRGGATIATNVHHSVEVKTNLPPQPNVTFSPIAGDNVIDQQERQGEITVSGKVDNANEGDEVIVSCCCPLCSGTAWETLKTKVQAGGFSVNFTGSQLAKEGYTVIKAQVTTTDRYGNQAIGEGEQSYAVEKAPLVEPEKMGGELVRISGRVNVDGLAAKYENPQQLHEITLKLNGKSYVAGVDLDQKFNLEIPYADLVAAKGLNLEFVGRGDPIYLLKKQFSVGGARLADDVVGEKWGTFQNEQVKLEENPYLQDGKVADFETVESEYQSGRTLSGNFVATFAHSQQEKPYFIASLSGDNPSQRGYLSRTFDYANTVKVSYSFFDASQDYRFAEINPKNRAEARKIFDLFSHYANVTFNEVGQWGEINYYLRDNSSNSDAEMGGRVAFGGRRGDGKASWRDWSTPEFQHLFMHETFHSFGAKHAHELRPASVNPTQVLPAQEDQSNLSRMTYRGQRMRLDDFDLRIYDLAYLHFRFGVNPKTRAGNDIYSFKDFDRYQADGNIYIWDGGGVDTFDASMENERVVVDLTPGSWIYRGQKADTLVIESSVKQTIDNFFATEPEYRKGWTVEYGAFDDLYQHTFTKGQAFIGYGTQIERLIGSRFDDVLKGNVADNDIFGGDGNDQIWGGGGNDYLNGGNGDDRLNGGAGNDILVGGFGKDTFVFDVLDGSRDRILDFNPQEDKIELSRAVFGDLTENALKTELHYDATSGQLSYRNQVFAELPVGLDAERIQIEVI